MHSCLMRAYVPGTNSVYVWLYVMYLTPLSLIRLVADHLCLMIYEQLDVRIVMPHKMTLSMHIEPTVKSGPLGKDMCLTTLEVSFLNLVTS